MRIKLLATLLIVVLTVWGASALAQRPAQPYQKWEYKIVNGCREEDRKIDIHKLGEEGWEMVNAQANECLGLSYYLKRPLREGTKAVPAPIPAVIAPARPATPRCSLLIEKAPVLRGIRLGMSVDELAKLFPQWAENSFFKNRLKDVDKPPSYGAVELNFQSSQVQRDAQKGIFDGVSRFILVVFDGRVSEINVDYQPTQQQPVVWTYETWIATLAENFSLPEQQSWSGTDARQLTCNGFEVRTSLFSFPDQSNRIVPLQWSNATLTVTDTSFKKILEQRIKEDQEKNRRAFKF